MESDDVDYYHDSPTDPPEYLEYQLEPDQGFTGGWALEQQTLEETSDDLYERPKTPIGSKQLADDIFTAPREHGDLVKKTESSTHVNTLHTLLQDPTMLFLLLNFEHAYVSSDEFTKLDAVEVCDFLSSDYLNVADERVVFHAICCWIDHDPKTRKRHVARLLKTIRLGLLSTEFFVQTVLPHHYVRHDKAAREIARETLRYLNGSDLQLSEQVDFDNPIARPRIPRDVLFVIGGWSGDAPTNAIETYDSRADSWAFCSTLGTNPRAYHGTAALDSIIYLIGGFDGKNYLASCRTFDPVTKVWGKAPRMHQKRCYLCVAVHNNQIYAFGGYDGTTWKRSAERYDPVEKSWTKIKAMINKRSDAGAAELGNKIYVCGGFDGSVCLDSAEVYNSDTDQWTLIRPMPKRRSGMGVIAYNDSIYALGGFNGTTRKSTCRRYNLETKEWTRIPDMYTPRSNFATAVVDDQLFAIGGYSWDGPIPSVECYDLNSDEWLDATDMSVNRSALSACVVGGLPNVQDYIHKRHADSGTPCPNFHSLTLALKSLFPRKKVSKVPKVPSDTSSLTAPQVPSVTSSVKGPVTKKVSKTGVTKGLAAKVSAVRLRKPPPSPGSVTPKASSPGLTSPKSSRPGSASPKSRSRPNSSGQRPPANKRTTSPARATSPKGTSAQSKGKEQSNPGSSLPFTRCSASALRLLSSKTRASQNVPSTPTQLSQPPSPKVTTYRTNADTLASGQAEYFTPETNIPNVQLCLADQSPNVWQIIDRSSQSPHVPRNQLVVYLNSVQEPSIYKPPGPKDSPRPSCADHDLSESKEPNPDVHSKPHSESQNIHASVRKARAAKPGPHTQSTPLPERHKSSASRASSHSKPPSSARSVSPQLPARSPSPNIPTSQRAVGGLANQKALRPEEHQKLAVHRTQRAGQEGDSNTSLDTREQCQITVSSGVDPYALRQLLSSLSNNPRRSPSPRFPSDPHMAISPVQRISIPPVTPPSSRKKHGKSHPASPKGSHKPTLAGPGGHPRQKMYTNLVTQNPTSRGPQKIQGPFKPNLAKLHYSTSPVSQTPKSPASKQVTPKMSSNPPSPGPVRRVPSYTVLASPKTDQNTAPIQTNFPAKPDTASPPCTNPNSTPTKPNITNSPTSVPIVTPKTSDDTSPVQPPAKPGCTGPPNTVLITAGPPTTELCVTPKTPTSKTPENKSPVRTQLPAKPSSVDPPTSTPNTTPNKPNLAGPPTTIPNTTPNTAQNTSQAQCPDKPISEGPPTIAPRPKLPSAPISASPRAPASPKAHAHPDTASHQEPSGADSASPKVPTRLSSAIPKAPSYPPSSTPKTHHQSTSSSARQPPTATVTYPAKDPPTSGDSTAVPNQDSKHNINALDPYALQQLG